ncbi:hypothetical protein PIB30_105938, partial [Stylosanthes scabra]|nr:hypothetical protein [Stylosanthes scabra]
YLVFRGHSRWIVPQLTRQRMLMGMMKPMGNEAPFLADVDVLELLNKERPTKKIHNKR